MTRPHASYAPIGVGFLLLSLPLFVAIPLSATKSGVIANLVTGALMVALGLALVRRRQG